MPLALALALVAVVLARSNGPDPAGDDGLILRLNDPCPLSLMHGETAWRVTLSVNSGERRISKLTNIKRGLMLEVRAQDGKLVRPAEPPPSSPPLPPPPPDDNHPDEVVIRPGAATILQVNEATRWVFPGPGRYQVRVGYMASNSQVWSSRAMCEVR